MKRNTVSLAVLLMLSVLVALPPASHSLADEPERMLVEFAPGYAAAVRSALDRAGGDVHYQFDRLNLFSVTLPAASMEGIAHNPNVVAVAPDVPRYPMAQETPWGIDRVQAPSVWAEGPTGSGVLVCVIDSGLYTSHEDLIGVTVDGGYPSGWNSDGCGHGTHVVGTIAAANNTTGVVGVTPGDASLYIVKVFGDDCGWAYESDLIDATDRCYDVGADIISMSLGGDKPIGPWEEQQFDWLWNQGLLSVAAAGNAGNTEKSYPASHDSVVSVAATDVNDVVADFSQRNDQVELAAPGVDVLSTVPWLVTEELTVDGVTYDSHHIEFAAYGTASGALVDGGLCDSTGRWSDNVVLCERGDISFYDKVMNVQNSDAVAAVIYNNEPGNFYGTLGEGNSSNVVAISLSQEDGNYLVANKLGFTGDVVSLSSKPDSGYEAWNGTSMATPHVSGVAALLWSSDATLTNADIRDAMNTTALDLGTTGRDDAYGYGLVQAYDAWAYLGGTVYEPVEADFSASPTSGPMPLNVDFTNASTGDYDTCSWDFGDSNTSTDCTGPQHVYTDGGVYTVVLDVSGAGGSDTLTRTNYITVYEAVQAAFSGSPTSGPAPLSVDFTNGSSGDYDTCAWNFGDGEAGTGCDGPSHTYTAAGAYTVTLAVSGLGGTDTVTRADYITVYEPPQADFTASPTEGVAPLTVDLENLSSGDYDTCQWDFGDGTTSVLIDPSHIYETPGEYTVALTVSGPGGSDTLTRTDYIAAYEAVVADFSGSPTSGLTPLTVDFTNASSGDYDTCLWDFGDGVTSTLKSPSHTYTAVGVYTVTLAIAGPAGTDTEIKSGFIAVEPPEYTLDVTIDGEGRVTKEPDQTTYTYGEVVTLTPAADPGWTFDAWGGPDAGDLVDNGDGSWDRVMDGNKSVTATFTELPPGEYTLTVDTVGSGRVTPDPAGGVYDEATVVELTAEADPGWEFIRWSGDLRGDSNPESIKMDENKTVTATFVEAMKVYLPLVLANH
jgi:serine protease